MGDRNYIRLYTATVVVGIDRDGQPEHVGQAIHDTLVREGFDISNAVFLERTTRKNVTATLKAAGVL